ncbi:hypothetical protein VOLCADRAFT_89041 [Volvox carteri f. nagariensis]|uniref:Uncharacterized protein n=1 Tax=Volvox carteri f. nagariensis TaxID=3068 RepID=D8TQM7_VOLCA|nr:uncharacterized protein VOLCADRAFT_89041 [Volvox carteri f. nagariensis]EFJ50179.1 hypothetical protein VOLCADRAFT_89041 [Volvox carteri f. nagariensis]|eukprot:XP_002948799.1 hypothetical protein VOLCADRAFT_89041 [Volvox carteri f. nagariensis]
MAKLLQMQVRILPKHQNGSEVHNDTIGVAKVAFHGAMYMCLLMALESDQPLAAPLLKGGTLRRGTESSKEISSLILRPTAKCRWGKYSHPLCGLNFTKASIEPVAKSVTDITSLFQGIGLPDGACVFNPAVVHVAGRIYCLFARVYLAKDPFRRCRLGYLDRSPFLDGWRGRSTNVLAVIRLYRRQDSRQLQAKLLGYSYLGHSNHEDGRLFKDKHGRLFAYLALPLGAPPKRAVINTVSRVLIRCTRASDNCTVSLGYPRLLSYFGESVMDKNWVPWNGTALMSYSHYGTFGPHSVFNWSSYDEPTFHTGFDFVAEDSVFPMFAARYGKLMHLSGGSPAIMEDGGQSFLAVGHLKAHPGCFHPEVTPEWFNRSLSSTMYSQVQSRCAHLASTSNTAQKQVELGVAFTFGQGAGVGIHYPLEYAFFFYRFSATPPYNMTHISYGFIPFIGGHASEHTGIVFPIGLERLGPSDYIVTYGDSDQASKILLIAASQVNAMLWPLPEIQERLDDYTVCGNMVGWCLRRDSLITLHTKPHTLCALASFSLSSPSKEYSCISYLIAVVAASVKGRPMTDKVGNENKGRLVKESGMRGEMV